MPCSLKRFVILTLEEYRSTKFFEKVFKTQNCWLWKAAKTNKGYGNFWNGQRLIMAHRFSYILHKGEIPDGMFVMHTCDNPPCVNPDHLVTGTPRENTLDMFKKGRNVSRYTYKQSRVADMVPAIRKRYSENECSYREICEEFGLSIRTVWLILSGKSYKDIK